jgi:RsiW-degrading membrane proteinase PrsW (M82 family)
MIIALISILVLIWIIYFRQAENAQSGRVSWVQKNWRLLLLSAMAILPFTFMNLFHYEGRSLSPAEQLADAEEHGTRKEIIAAYAYNIKMYPDSVPLYFGYSDARRMSNSQTCPVIDWSVFTSDAQLIGIAQEYHAAQCYGDIEEFIVAGDHDFDLNRLRYANFVRGLRARTLGENELAESYFLAEIRLNPTYAESYVELSRIYRSYMPEKFDALLADSRARSYLPTELLQYHFFTRGRFGLYMKEIFDDRYMHIDPLAFLAGLIISLVWLIYLRSLDVFRKERWFDLLLVFTGGVFFTMLCLPLYDLSHYAFNFYINGDSLNDFLYCTAVIGGSEELVKMLPWVLFAIFTRKLKEPYDYILYASVAALGFAFAENWSYLENPDNIFGRFLTSTVSHLFNASLFAYSLVLARFKFQHKGAKILAPIAGFALACLCHGFYDFWLLSPATRGLSFITTLFLLLSIHVWFHLKNNAINHSQFYRNQPFDYFTPLNVFMFGVIGVLMVEYVLIGYEYGARWANYALRSESWMGAVFLAYMSFNLQNIRPVRGVWKSYRLPRFSGIVSRFFSLPGSIPEKAQSANLQGLNLRLFAPKTNPWIGALFPASGHCARKMTLSGQDDWYVFYFNKPLNLPNFRNDAVIIRPKSMYQTLEGDKIEIYLLLIPNTLELVDGLEVKQLRYPGKAYSRPI